MNTKSDEIKQINKDILDIPEDGVSEVIKMPDGGYGWLIVVASFLMQGCSIGSTVGFGVFVDYYYNNDFKGSEYSQISLIGTIAPVTIALSSMFVGRVCSMIGFRKCILIGTVFMLLGYILASFSTQVWHLVITQGFLFGLGGGLVYIPANSVVSQWFTKYRGLAVGLGTAGSGVGGMIFGMLNAYLLPHSGFQWTLRYNAIIFLVCLTFAIIVVKPYLQTHKNNIKKVQPAKETILSAKFLLFTLSVTFAVPAHIVVLYYLPPYATSYGLSPEQGATLISVLNVTNGIGRIIFGFIGDKIGHFNLYIFCISISGLLTIIWRFAYSFPILIVFSVIYGFPSGGFASLFSSSCTELFGLDNLTTLLGLAYAPSALGDLMGPPLGGLIYDRTKEYAYLIYYGMALYFISSSFAIIIRIFYVKRKGTSKEQTYA